MPRRKWMRWMTDSQMCLVQVEVLEHDEDTRTLVLRAPHGVELTLAEFDGLLAALAEARVLIAPAPVEPPRPEVVVAPAPRVLDLMAQLEQSLAQAKADRTSS